MKSVQAFLLSLVKDHDPLLAVSEIAVAIYENIYPASGRPELASRHSYKRGGEDAPNERRFFVDMDVIAKPGNKYPEYLHMIMIWKNHIQPLEVKITVHAEGLKTMAYILFQVGEEYVLHKGEGF